LKIEFFDFKLTYKIFNNVEINHDSQLVFMRIDVDAHVYENVIDNVVFFDSSLQDEDNVYKFQFFFAYLRFILLNEIKHFDRTWSCLLQL
jgi:hypothetical protein